tara:strand:+ start:68 stop:898 length:831 start_codon:yes stop_codon:yes gene_type:complete
MNKKLTVKDLRNFKGSKKLVSILAKNVEEAKAAHKVGFELLATGSPGLYKNPDNHPHFEEIIKIRDACPYSFMHWGAADTLYSGLHEATKIAFMALEHGIDMFYCHNNFDLIKDLYKQGIPGLGHVGLVPSRRTWTGGFRAVGKNSTEAMMIYEQCLRIQDAGGVAIEMECVPYKIAEAITKKVEPTVVSMGSGPGCDAEFLFGCDVLGITDDHIPRHAKKYRNFKKEYSRLQKEREDAFQEFYNDVQSGNFPENKHIIEIEENELDKFLNNLEKR